MSGLGEGGGEGKGFPSGRSLVPLARLEDVIKATRLCALFALDRACTLFDGQND